ncbi:MAG: hypothetical protein ACPGC9_00345 [Cytophagales bacterium]
MNFNFFLQASQPRLAKTPNYPENSLSDAIEEIYLANSEDMIMRWNWIYVPLNYKYDLSYIIVDIMQILEALLGQDRGRFETSFPSCDFAVTWKLHWSGPQLKIDSHWEGVVGGTEPQLNAQPLLEIDKRSFLCEWKKPLVQVLADLRRAGYDTTLLPEMGRLQRIVAQIPEFGLLYR